MAFPPLSQPYSRRRFLHQLLATSALTVTGLDSLLAQTLVTPGTQSFRFTFLTDFHLMKDEGARSAQGIAACLKALEKLDPKPDFILAGGDLVHLARDLTITEAGNRLDLFLKIWKDNTALPAYWTFGNHDLVGTSNAAVVPDGKYYGKGLFKDRLHLPQLFYSFDHKGWHFVVLDDIAPQPDRTYIGKLFDDELQFLQADLEAHKTTPTIICTHIPIVSNLPVMLGLMKGVSPNLPTPKNLVCTNTEDFLPKLPGHNIRAILSGHLHHFEALPINNIPVINSGAVCGNYWQGPAYGCNEGFGVVDLHADGTVAFDYRDYGWKAT